MFHDVFGYYGVAVIGSIIACYTSQVIDVGLYLYISKLTNGQHLWLRNIVSTGISLFIDTENNYLRDSLVLTSVWFFMAVGSQTAWCLMGKYMRKFATSERFIRNFNYTMSFLLIVCVILFYV